MSDTPLPPDPPLDPPTPPHGVPPIVPERLRVAESPHGRTGPGGRVGRRRHRRRSRLTRRGYVLVAGVAVLLVLGAAVGWYEAEVHPLGSEGRAVEVDVRPGASESSVDAQLTAAGVIGSSFAFRLWTIVHGQPTVRPGLYLLHENEPFATVSSELTAGPNVYEVDVVPGETLAEVAHDLSAIPGALAQPFLDAARTDAVPSPYQSVPGATLEGLVGAGSYEVLPGETAHELLSQMVGRFDTEAAKAGLTPSAVVGGLDAYQLITAASIDQKEGYFTRYLGDVMRVIDNRLAAGMHLDMTSTVLYSLGQDGGTVTPAEEADPTPYNTYLNAGLTPTPICVPSAAALAAAVAPPQGSWLYFDLVTAKKGTMVFSSTYTGQLAAEQQAAASAAAQHPEAATAATP